MSGLGVEDLQEKIPVPVDWCLAEHDVENDKAGRIVLDVHADFYDFDPTGRRGEPRTRRSPPKKKWKRQAR